MKKPDKEIPRNPGVDVDDEIFFQCQRTRQPRAGKVIAHGKHGATVKASGEVHKVRWQHFLGHKSRAVHQVTMIDHGEDGAIVRDKNGRHKFVAGEIDYDNRPAEPGEEDIDEVSAHLKKHAPLQKSFDAPVVFVMAKRR